MVGKELRLRPFRFVSSLREAYSLYLSFFMELEVDNPPL